MTTVKLQQIKHSLFATIPRWFCHNLKLVKGDILIVEARDGGVFFRPIQPHQLGPASATGGLDQAHRKAEERGA